MTELAFEIEFHGPFLPATGAADDGYDASVDLSAPLPATAVKGLMRAAARDVLQLRADLVNGIFGTARSASPWYWIVDAFEVRTIDVNRVAIDPQTHTASDNQLLLARAGIVPDAASRARFTVERSRDAPRRERVILTAAARAVHALGAQRRRGLGWVGLTGGEALAEPDYANLVGEWRR